ncbi:MAG: hypothetical protein ACRC9X_08750 [Bacteroidales bacterium]
MKQEMSLLEKISAHLFRNTEEAQVYLSEKEVEIKKRWFALYTLLLNDPLKSNKEIIIFLRSGGNGAFEAVSERTAYIDIERVRTLLGDVKTASKSWVRYVVYENAIHALKLAKDKNDVVGMVMAMNVLGKYFKLDKDEIDAMDWENMPKPNFEPSSNIALLNIPNDRIKDYEERRIKLRRKLNMAVDVEYTESNE